MKLEEFQQLFALAPEKFPNGLATRYGRVLNRILEKWENQKEAEAFLNELVVDTRGDRQGFPPEILQEILFVAQVHAKWSQEKRRKADPQKLRELSKALVPDIEKNMPPCDDLMSKKLQTLKLMARKNDPQLMAKMQELNVTVNQKDKADGQTLLMQAASSGAEETMLALLKAKANPHMTDITGNTALHWAVVSSRSRAVEILLYFGANPDEKNKAGASPLALAAIKTEARLTQRLLDYGADVQIMDNQSNTPLHKAVGARAEQNVWLLLQAGAQRDLRNAEGVSAEAMAAQIPEIKAVFDRHRASLMGGAVGNRDRS